MSPWRMMNEWGIPPVETPFPSLSVCDISCSKGEICSSISRREDLLLRMEFSKALALGAPFVKARGNGPWAYCSAMVGKTIGRPFDHHPNSCLTSSVFGNSKDEIFVTASALRKELGDMEFEGIPTGALGLYTYYERLAQGFVS